MGRPYDHQYHNAATSSAGTMICAACNKPITEGEFRSYKRTKDQDWGYVTHHRACSENDPQWALLDKRRADNEERWNSFVAAVHELAAEYPDFSFIAALSTDVRKLAA
jgi:hypothetical protein